MVAGQQHVIHREAIDNLFSFRKRGGCLTLSIGRGRVSKKVLAHEAALAVNTVLNFFDGGGLQPAIAQRIAMTFRKNVTDLLAPWDPRYVPPNVPSGPTAGMPEWTTQGYLDQGRLAPNGLYYIVCRMQHRHTAGRLGRGKFYHLCWLPAGKRDEMQHKLARHANVCERLGSHPNIVINHSSTPVANDDGWWVIDQWVGPQSLQSILKAGRFPTQQLPRLLHDIALGLSSPACETQDGTSAASSSANPRGALVAGDHRCSIRLRMNDRAVVGWLGDLTDQASSRWAARPNLAETCNRWPCQTTNSSMGPTPEITSR